MSLLVTGSASAHQSRSDFWTSIAWYLPALALAAVFGAATALGGKLMMIFAFGAIGGLAVLFAPIQLVLGFFLILTFLVVGPLTSIAKISQATWAPYMIALVLLIRVPMEWYQTSKQDAVSQMANKAVSPVLWVIGFYFFIMLISIGANLPTPLQVLVGGKLYIFIWGLFFLLVVSSIRPETLERMWKGLLVVAVLQLPFALYQRLVEVPRRYYAKGVTALDAIVGTFPGSADGGANGSLAMFCVFSMALAISLWRNKLLGGGAALVVVLASLISIALGEVKVILVLFPLAFIVVNRREILRRPLYFLGMGAVVLAILGGVFTLYRDESTVGQRGSTLEHIERSFGYILDPNNIQADGEVGRFAALNLWYRDGRQTPQTFLLGYGPGASQDSSIGRGVVASRYTPLSINATTAAGMLWDIGVVGLAAFFAVLIVAFFEALRLVRLPRIPAFHRSALEASALMMALVGVMVPYDSDVLTVPQFQVLFLLALYQVAYWHSRSNVQGDSSRK
jgi:O-antigen ligase